MKREIQTMIRRRNELVYLMENGGCNRAEMARSLTATYWTVRNDMLVFRAFQWVEWEPYGLVRLTVHGQLIAEVAASLPLPLAATNNNGWG